MSAPHVGAGCMQPADSATQARKLGGVIRRTRKEYMLTQPQLALMIGISDRTLREIEKGTGSPSVKAVLATLETLGLELDVR
ncbi:helix-turn-helix domain-containing protein [Corynebacterium propinquum]|uniref:Helix-turn-helix domain-containing protein n=1 Tax=Corynebacterium propinquum TaxID=43769 RepID=A0ABT7G0E8_9CORY|nr:helix-turn-helix domain-containing protein [Corynebacterium propinquum]MDK4234543.1 helix-turn-helix domain-containing protein [Corynebacterium propinquum]MDK4300204.1 helix-turn-helix domain-containing protein [Corynebacterium propinquum]MDK4313408.1 helix-turn-helix domain-containing protein [Corynebacterium propinquum]WKS27567.1 helix-turn-helix domain-containing protein [Corynebacterium propinquum]WKS50304.1 helix-turn-helix domain-containing protein [Corynebacterium propinquum]